MRISGLGGDKANRERWSSYERYEMGLPRDEGVLESTPGSGRVWVW